LFFKFQIDQLEKYMSKSLIHAILWSFTGDAKMKVRDAMGDFIRSATTIPLPPNVRWVMEFLT
jgi:dynein heavy chain 1